MKSSSLITLLALFGIHLNSSAQEVGKIPLCQSASYEHVYHHATNLIQVLGYVDRKQAHGHVSSETVAAFPYSFGPESGNFKTLLERAEGGNLVDEPLSSEASKQVNAIFYYASPLFSLVIYRSSNSEIARYVMIQKRLERCKVEVD